jgi:hypothetical protein
MERSVNEKCSNRGELIPLLVTSMYYFELVIVYKLFVEKQTISKTHEFYILIHGQGRGTGPKIRIEFVFLTFFIPKYELDP